ncbi:MAG: VCBS repeat-containing protein [Bacteroidota bacterium]
MNAPHFFPLAALAVLLAASGLAACGGGDDLFFRRGAETTGVTFENTIAEEAGFTILDYLYYYNGGGVSAGDVNGDGLPDLYFTANEGPNALYLNRTEEGGVLQFEDITEAAGVAGTSDWTTGTTMADVDGDGDLDLYVSALGSFRDQRGRNELFLNEGAGADGVPVFREAAAEVGLAFEGFGTQALFFDYDRDGDLDVYLLNHAVHTDRTYQEADSTRQRDERSGDRLYRNDASDDAPLFFTEVTEEAGIISGLSGYGLSIVASDLNGDGWLDLYVGNDFHDNDFVYLNEQDGTFREVSQTALGHASRFSMGADAGDVDGDGRPDLVVLDMLPRKESILKTSVGDDTYDIANLKLEKGYGPQLSRNTLQVNRGLGPDSIPRFSDLAPLAGVEATDWSWTALLADYDLDGRLDLYVTNGIWRRPNDLDYINYVGNAVVQQAMASGVPDDSLGIFERMPQVEIPNEAFRGVGDVRFEPTRGAWGLDDPFFSNGAATADLDNDGDLDLVVNNLNAPAAIYENRAADRGAMSLRVTLEGDTPNTGGIGARVTAWVEGRSQSTEVVPSRGYLSSVDPRPLFGLGTAADVDSLRIVWPDGRTQTLIDVPAGALTLRQSDATEAAPSREVIPSRYADVTTEVGLDGWRHRENIFIDFNRERLMPHKLSRLGPAMAVEDVNGDGLDDVFLGGAEGQASTLFLQTAGGTFRESANDVFAADSLAEDVVAQLFDANGDGALDLYVGTAGNRQWGEVEVLRDRLYLGDGAGRFTRATDALPDLFGHTGAVAPGDFDGDGDTDLFVGGRVVPREYGKAPRSVLLENDGSGRFTDVTAEKAPALEFIGMVSAAAAADLDGDGRDDLALAGEWMAPTIAQFTETGTLAPRDAGLADATGWYNALHLADVDGDGVLDLVLGNLGLNSRIQATAERPARLALADFDANDQLDGILTVFRDGQDYPFDAVLTLSQQFPELRERYPTATEFGARTLDDLFGARLSDAEIKEARSFASAVAWGDGSGGFTLQPLPTFAQAEPMYAAWAETGRIVLGGGLLGVRPDRGRYDGYGVALSVASDRTVTTDPLEGGLLFDGEVRQIAPLSLADGSQALLVATSDGPPRVFRVEDERPTVASAAR